jgi:hypothetical protein
MSTANEMSKGAKLYQIVLTSRREVLQNITKSLSN